MGTVVDFPPLLELPQRPGLEPGMIPVILVLPVIRVERAEGDHHDAIPEDPGGPDRPPSRRPF